MGYRKTTRRIEVTLQGHKVYGQDTEYPIAYARGKTLGEYLQLIGEIPPEEDDDRSPIVRQLEEFGDSLLSWNLEEEDGTPIPCTRKAFFEQVDDDLALVLATEWVERLGGKVDAPLESNSPPGELSPVASIPTEALSALPEPSSMPA